MGFIRTLAKRKLFWSLAGGVLSFLIVLSLANFWIAFWRPLPALPNGDRGTEIVGITMDSVDIATEKHYYYRCAFDEPSKCWELIFDFKNEDYNYQNCNKYPHALTPWLSEKVYLVCHLHESHSEMMKIVILRSGQVAVWNADYIGLYPPFYAIVNLMLAGVSIPPGMMVGLFVALIFNRRKTKRNDPSTLAKP